MRVRVIAADSMGVRSLATVVEACGEVIGIDLGASMAPTRYGLPPHPLELEELDSRRREALKWLERSSTVVITHYHYDHYMREHPEAYEGKQLFVKHPERDINNSQRRRAWTFLEKEGVRSLASRVEYADAQVFELPGGAVIEFSPPVWHGEPGSRVGRVLMLRVTCEGDSMVFMSDTQGPADPRALEVLSSWASPRPRVVVSGGPPTYFAGYKVTVESVEQGLKGLLQTIRLLRPSSLVVDHHLLRDLNYRDKIAPHQHEAERLGVRLLTAAEYMHSPLRPLEALRKRLWRGEE